MPGGFFVFPKSRQGAFQVLMVWVQQCYYGFNSHLAFDWASLRCFGLL